MNPPATLLTDVRVRDMLRLACTRIACTGRPGGGPMPIRNDAGAGAPLHFGQGFHDAWEEAQALVLGGLGLPWTHADAVLDARLSASEVERLIAWLERRVRERVPIAHLTGVAWFAGLEFDVTPDVLIPRSPIGEFIEAGLQPWLGAREPATVLDLCCGSGCIGIATTLALGAPRLLLADVSAAAIEVATRNVARHDITQRTECCVGDLYASLPMRYRGRIELILCNPPYVPRAVVDALPGEFTHEPRIALDGGEDGLDLVRRIVDGAAEWLTDDGLLLLEVGAGGAQPLRRLLGNRAHDWPDWGAGICLIEAAALRA